MIKSAQFSDYTSEIIEFELKRKYHLPIAGDHFLNRFFETFEDTIFYLSGETLYRFDEMDILHCDLSLVCYTNNYDIVEYFCNDLRLFSKKYAYEWFTHTDENKQIIDCTFAYKYPYSSLNRIKIEFFSANMKQINDATDKIIIDTEAWITRQVCEL